MSKLVFRSRKGRAENGPSQEDSIYSVSLPDNSLKPIHQAKMKPSILPYNSILVNNMSREYFDSLKVPSYDQIRYISAIQERKEQEIMKRLLDENLMSHTQRSRGPSEDAFDKKKISEKRLTIGFLMSPTDRWVEAIRELCYRKSTWPYEHKNNKLILGKESHKNNVDNTNNATESSKCRARRNWKKVGLIAQRAGRDEDPGSELIMNRKLGKESINLCNTRQSTKENLRKKAKLMDIQYFLEMVDPKHRYGPNLRIYHEVWKTVTSRENFFQWLDFGEGLHISCQACSRERLERERVRYLSKEERSDYLVALDYDGRLYWAKNGIPVDTSVMSSEPINEKVLATDFSTKTLANSAELPQDILKYEEKINLPMNSSSFISCLQKYLNKHKKNGKYTNTTAYAATKLNRTPNPKIIRNISVATIIDRLLRGSVKKNTWIFVADTNFHIYIGMKQSGIFQHSSFLHGSRVSAAGSIKVKDGKVCKLSPLSGHYRTPVTNFRGFLRALKEAGVDTSQTSISRSYFILIGLESYSKACRMSKKFVDNLSNDNIDLPGSQIPHQRKKKRRILNNFATKITGNKENSV